MRRKKIKKVEREKEGGDKKKNAKAGEKKERDMKRRQEEKTGRRGEGRPSKRTRKKLGLSKDRDERQKAQTTYTVFLVNRDTPANPSKS